MLLRAAVPAAAAVLAAGTAAYAANWPTSQLFGRTIVAGRDPRQLALTYDDGPNDPWTGRLLDVLARHGVRATFFLIGGFVRQRPGIVRELLAAGHLIGNHTMHHPVLLWQSSRRVHEELAACNAAIEDATGEPVRFFRPPHGARRPDVLRTAASLGLEPVMWNAMGHDWDAASADQIAARVERETARNRLRGHGSNILLHDGGQARLGVDRGFTVAATAALLDRWRDAEYRYVTADVWSRTAARSD